MDERKQWERQEGETAKAFEAFCAYRDLPTAERSLRNAWAKYRQQTGNKSVTMPGRFGDWSSGNRWVDRAAAYDDYKDAQSRAEYESDRIKQRGNRQAIIKNLETMLGRIMKSNELKVLSIDDLNKLATAATKITNESRVEFDDLPTQRNEHTGAGGGAIEVEHSADDTVQNILGKLAGIATANEQGGVPGESDTK